MKKNSSFLICLSLAVLFLVGCYYHRPDYSDARDLTEEKEDSLNFETTHHYAVNYNFLLVSDSLSLRTGRPYHNPAPSEADVDSVSVFEGDRLVVADIMIVSEDSADLVWVKVARDQYTMGWIHEKDLLENAIPADPISQFIHAFSDIHLICFICVLCLLSVVCLIFRMRRKRFHMVHFDDVGSPYPTWLCLTLSGAATLYAGIQSFVPDMWIEFYFHPTLNPFGLPFVLGLFLALVWAIVLLAIASVEDVCRLLPLREALLYLFALLGVCAVCYLFFSLATLYFVGYPCLLVYAVWALCRYYRHARCSYVCGSCGARIRAKGRCPYCGAWNE